MSKMTAVLLGTGTPNADPQRSGPAVALIVGEDAYIVDFGPGLVRQAAKAYEMGIEALAPPNLKYALCTHLHSDHTLGYADLIFTPWVLGRKDPLKVWGPKGLQTMTDHLHAAYDRDIQERMEGKEPANPEGWKVEVTEIEAGVIHQKDGLTIEAFPVSHGSFISFGYKFTSPERTIVVSGDTAPTEELIDQARGCDLLIHEAYYAKGWESRSDEWKAYHATVHTSTLELGQMAKEIQPKKLVLYHQLFMMDHLADPVTVQDRIKAIEEEMLKEVKSVYDGHIVSGQDMGIY
jgi:ribonuclease BN (tRNA processing enzyme)